MRQIYNAFLVLFIVGNVHLSTIQAQVKNKKAFELMQNSEYESALELLDKQKQSPETESMKTLCYLNILRIEKTAITVLERNYRSLEKSLLVINPSLNPEGYSDEIKNTMAETTTALNNMGVEFYNNEKPKSAFSCLQMANNLEEKMGKIDTVRIYTLGKMAKKIDLDEESIYYLKKGIEIGMNNPDIYFSLIDLYKTKNNKNEYISTIKAATAKFPGNQNFDNLEINYYLENNEAAKALEKIEKISPEEKYNRNLWLAKAAVLNILEQTEQSEKTFKYILEQDSKDFEALVGLGNLHLERSVAEKSIQNEENQHLKLAKDYLERAYAIDPENVEVMSALSQLYTLMGTFDKYEAIKKKLDQKQ